MLQMMKTLNSSKNTKMETSKTWKNTTQYASEDSIQKARKGSLGYLIHLTEDNSEYENYILRIGDFKHELPGIHMEVKIQVASSGYYKKTYCTTINEYISIEGNNIPCCTITWKLKRSLMEHHLGILTT